MCMAAGHKMMQINAVNIILRAPSAKVSIKILTLLAIHYNNSSQFLQTFIEYVYKEYQICSSFCQFRLM